MAFFSGKKGLFRASACSGLRGLCRGFGPNVYLPNWLSSKNISSQQFAAEVQGGFLNFFFCFFERYNWLVLFALLFAFIYFLWLVFRPYLRKWWRNGEGPRGVCTAAGKLQVERSLKWIYLWILFIWIKLKINLIIVNDLIAVKESKWNCRCACRKKEVWERGAPGCWTCAGVYTPEGGPSGFIKVFLFVG